LLIIVKVAVSIAGPYLLDYYFSLAEQYERWIRPAFMLSSYIINIIIAVVMKRFDTVSVPILILALVHSEIAALFFLVELTYTMLKARMGDSGFQK
jgi:hypothetical protein